MQLMGYRYRERNRGRRKCERTERVTISYWQETVKQLRERGRETNRHTGLILKEEGETGKKKGGGGGEGGRWKQSDRGDECG